MQDFRVKPAQSQGSVVQGGNLAPTCAKCGWNNLSKCHAGCSGCFKCVQEGHIIIKFPKSRQGNKNQGNRTQSSSGSPAGRIYI